MNTQSSVDSYAQQAAFLQNSRAISPAVTCFGEAVLRTGGSVCATRFELLKERIRGELTRDFGAFLSSRLLEQSVRDAEALAAVTAVPALVFPELAREKAREAKAWQSRQRRVYQRTLAFAA